jgi:hypothetical protein
MGAASKHNSCWGQQACVTADEGWRSDGVIAVVSEDCKQQQQSPKMKNQSTFFLFEMCFLAAR